MTWTASFYYVFSYLACFVGSTCMIFSLVCWILMAYASSATYLFARFFFFLVFFSMKMSYTKTKIGHNTR